MPPLGDFYMLADLSSQPHMNLVHVFVYLTETCGRDNDKLWNYQENNAYMLFKTYTLVMSASVSPFQWAWSRTFTPRLDAGLRPGKMIHRARHGSWTRLRAVFILEVAVVWLGRLYSCMFWFKKCQPDTFGLKTRIFPNPTYRWNCCRNRHPQWLHYRYPGLPMEPEG